MASSFIYKLLFLFVDEDEVLQGRHFLEVHVFHLTFLPATFLSRDYIFMSWDIWLEVAGPRVNYSWHKKYRKRFPIEDID